MKGRYKIKIIDLDKDKEILDAEIDDLTFAANRPLEHVYGPGFGGIPVGLQQTGPTSYKVEALSHAEMHEFNMEEGII